MTPTQTPTRSLAEAALLAGCSTRTLRRYVAAELVGAVRIGGPRGALRFTDQDIEDAINARAVRVDKATACQGQTTLITLDGDVNLAATPEQQSAPGRAA